MDIPAFIFIPTINMDTSAAADHHHHHHHEECTRYHPEQDQYNVMNISNHSDRSSRWEGCSKHSSPPALPKRHGRKCNGACNTPPKLPARIPTTTRLSSDKTPARPGR